MTTAATAESSYAPMWMPSSVQHWLLAHPRWLGRSSMWLARLLAAAARDLLAVRGRVHTLSLMTHDFMHACALDRDRIDSCVFKAMTADGPLSMCIHNARRDDFITRPLTLRDGRIFDPLEGRRGNAVEFVLPDPVLHGLKRARGRSRECLISAKQQQ